VRAVKHQGGIAETIYSRFNDKVLGESREERHSLEDVGRGSPKSFEDATTVGFKRASKNFERHNGIKGEGLSLWGRGWKNY